MWSRSSKDRESNLVFIKLSKVDIIKSTLSGVILPLESNQSRISMEVFSIYNYYQHTLKKFILQKLLLYLRKVVCVICETTGVFIKTVHRFYTIYRKSSILSVSDSHLKCYCKILVQKPSV